MRTETEPPRELTGRTLGALHLSAASVLYVLLLFLLGVVSPQDRLGAALTLTVGGLLGPIGAIPLWRVGRRVRSLWLLRRRGIGVVGEVTGTVRIWSKGPHLWVFSKMTFRTVLCVLPNVPGLQG
ncbi:hypothetical protein AB0A69_20165 [Streptomyces sp. NPDC045431]|uniref:hypothetical protein n=1 Tax=Streptomyces sp. NPDC045431 TaxID=3155613 RepID=UPI0033DE8360